MSSEKKHVRGGTEWIYGLQFWKELIDGGLLDKFPVDLWPEDALLIQYHPDEYKFRFHLFANHLEFCSWLTRVPMDKRMFFETIMGSRPQKPHFDLDVKSPPKRDEDDRPIETLWECKMRNREVGQRAVRQVIAALLEIIPGLSAEKDIIVCTSDHDYKASYHVIVDNYMCVNAVECKALYRRVLEKMPDEDARDAVDHAVYGSKQQFRMLGSRKYDKNNVKIIDPTFPHEWEGEWLSSEHEWRCKLAATLVTATQSCTLLDFFTTPEERQKITSRGFASSVDIDESALMALLSTWMGRPASDVFSIREARQYEDGGQIVDLTRHAESRCVLCARLKGEAKAYHQHENPRVSILATGAVWFNCRRVDSGPSGQFVGNLKETPPVEAPELPTADAVASEEEPSELENERKRARVMREALENRERVYSAKSTKNRTGRAMRARPPK